jgi:hypothetical protein
MILRSARPLFLFGIAGMFMLVLGSMFLAVGALFRDLRRHQ